jgi:hypothetical protein
LQKDHNGWVRAFVRKPVKNKYAWIDNGYVMTLGVLSNLFNNINWEDKEPLNIAIEIGAFDWSTVPDNTPVYVRRSNTGQWKARLFHNYRENTNRPFVCYWGGLSKHTIENVPPGEPKFTAWEQCKLAD